MLISAALICGALFPSASLGKGRTNNLRKCVFLRDFPTTAEGLGTAKARCMVRADHASGFRPGAPIRRRETTFGTRSREAPDRMCRHSALNFSGIGVGIPADADRRAPIVHQALIVAEDGDDHVPFIPHLSTLVAAKPPQGLLILS